MVNAFCVLSLSVPRSGRHSPSFFARSPLVLSVLASSVICLRSISPVWWKVGVEVIFPCTKLLGVRTASAAQEGSVEVSTEAKCVPARMFLATLLIVAKSGK